MITASIIVTIVLLAGFIFFLYSPMLKGIILLKVTKEDKSKNLVIDFEDTDTLEGQNIYVIANDNVKLGGWIIKPKKEALNPHYCILFHGNSNNREQFYNIFHVERLLKNQNIILLIPDFRGFGDSDGTFSFEKSSTDILAFYKHFVKHHGAKNVSFISFSLGGTIALLYLDFKYKEMIGESLKDHLNNELYVPEKIVFVSPMISLKDVIVNFTAKYYRLDYVVRKIPYDIDKRIGLKVLKRFNFLTKEKTLLIYSKTDELIPQKTIDRIKDKCMIIAKENLEHNKILNEKTWDEISNFICEENNIFTI